MDDSSKTRPHARNDSDWAAKPVKRAPPPAWLRLLLRRSLALLAGLLVGCLLNHLLHSDQCEELATPLRNGRSASEARRQFGGQKRVLVGVMTARSFLDNRAVAQFASWGQDLPGDIMFFSSEGSTSKYDIPVVALHGVDDTYPPQKKSFLMLKYMHDHFLNEYEWFMRVDDDAYIKGDRLEKFLCTLNSSVAQHIGQPGFGRPDEVGKLGIDQDYAYCMGGPGVIMSKKTLAMVGPHVGYCLQNLYSWHEDSEVGRCVYQYAGASCTKAYDIKRFLYHQYDYKLERKDAFPYNLAGDEVDDSISLHPIKSPQLLYRLHAHVQGLTALHRRERIRSLGEELRFTRQAQQQLQQQPAAAASAVRETPFGRLQQGLPLSQYQPTQKGEAVEWELHSYGSIYSHRHSNPKRGAENDARDLLRAAYAHVLNKTKGNYLYKPGKYALLRGNPLMGVDLLLDLQPDPAKLRGKRSPPPRKTAYVRLPLTHLEAREVTWNGTRGAAPPDSLGGDGLVSAVRKSLADMSYLSGQPGGGGRNLAAQTVNIIITLYRKYDVLVRFLDNFVSVCLRRSEPVTLLFVLHDSEDRNRTLALVERLLADHPAAPVRVVDAPGVFSRGRSLNLGASLFADDELLYFLDVDIFFSAEHLERIRRNTLRGEQVYYPIFFHQYDNGLVCNRTVCDPTDFSDETGFFRAYSYGMISVYKGDFARIGGFDDSIEGWGLEDVELCEKIIRSNLTLFRTVDPNFTHVYHYRDCDEDLKKTNKYDMCVLSRAGGYISERFLSAYVYAGRRGPPSRRPVWEAAAPGGGGGAAAASATTKSYAKGAYSRTGATKAVKDAATASATTKAAKGAKPPPPSKGPAGATTRRPSGSTKAPWRAKKPTTAAAASE